MSMYVKHLSMYVNIKFHLFLVKSDCAIPLLFFVTGTSCFYFHFMFLIYSIFEPENVCGKAIPEALSTERIHQVE